MPDLVREDGVQLAFVQPLEQPSRDPDARIAARVAERERIGVAVVNDPELHQRYAGLPAARRDHGADGVLGAVAGFRALDDRRGDEVLDDPRVDRIRQQRECDREREGEPHRRVQEGDDREACAQDQREHASERGKGAAKDEAHEVPPRTDLCGMFPCSSRDGRRRNSGNPI